MNADRLIAAMEATWPPARRWREGEWTLRDGAGGGKRVSAATLEGDWDGSLPAPLVMVRPDQGALDDALAAAGYAVIDPVVLYCAPVAGFASAQVPAHWPPAAQAQDLWAAAGIGPARIAVMARVAGPKAVLMARETGVAFVALDGDVAMLHALEVAPQGRRSGTGELLLNAAADWAKGQGASHLALAVTEANIPARALYRKAGMVPTGGYHYRER